MSDATALVDAIDALRAQRRYADARDLAAAAVVARQDGDPEDLAEALLELGRGDSDMGLHEDAAAAWRRALAAAGAAPTLTRLATVGELAAVLAHLGSPAEAGALGDEVVALAVLVDRPGVAGALAFANAALAAAELGLDDAAKERLSTARALLPTVPTSARDARAAVGVATATGEAHRLRGRYAEALAAYGEALAIAERYLGEDAIEVGAIRNDSGVCRKFAGRFAEAEADYARALAILGPVGGDAHPDAATIYHNLGGLAHARGDHAAAEGPARRAVELRETALGPGHPLVVRDRVALAAILDALGQGDEAAAILTDSIERLSAALGPTHPEVAVALNNLAAIEGRAGRLDEAAVLYERAIAIKEASAAAPSSLAITVNNLATVHRRLGRHAAAERGYRQALALLDGSVEPDHPAIGAINANLRALERKRAQLVMLQPRPPRPPDVSPH